MRGFGDKFSRVIERIELLTEAVLIQPDNRELKWMLKKAEDGLCNMIRREQTLVNKLIESLNEPLEWDQE